MGIVAAHRLKKIREFLAYQELATWRRMNSFDRVLEGEENWLHGHRSLSPTPEQHTASLRLDLKKLQHSISMPPESTVARPRQKTMDVVDGRRSNSLDELLAHFEFARIKEYVEKRSRDEAAQVQVTVTQVDNVQPSRPCPLDPEPSSSVYVKWRTPWGEWTQRETSSNHHQLVRVSKRPDSSVPRTRGYGSKDEPPPTVS